MYFSSNTFHRPTSFRPRSFPRSLPPVGHPVPRNIQRQPKVIRYLLRRLVILIDPFLQSYFDARGILGCSPRVDFFLWGEATDSATIGVSVNFSERTPRRSTFKVTVNTFGIPANITVGHTSKSTPSAKDYKIPITINSNLVYLLTCFARR